MIVTAMPDPRLFDRNDQAAKNHPDEVPCIDFDPGLDAQDFDQKSVSKTLKLTEAADGDSAEVTATFNLFSEGDESKREMVWSLKKIDGRWKVADITSKTSGWNGCSIPWMCANPCSRASSFAPRWANTIWMCRSNSSACW